MTNILVFAVIVILIVALLVYAVDYLGVRDPFGRLIQALIIIIGALVIANRAGVL